jgi:hypothetical protein
MTLNIAPGSTATFNGIAELLGSDAAYLLDHTCQTIEKDSSRCPARIVCGTSGASRTVHHRCCVASNNFTHTAG